MKFYRMYNDRKLVFSLDIDEYESWSMQIEDSEDSISFVPSVPSTVAVGEYLLFNSEEPAVIEVKHRIAKEDSVAGVITPSWVFDSTIFTDIAHSRGLTVTDDDGIYEWVLQSDGTLVGPSAIPDTDYYLYAVTTVYARNGAIPILPRTNFTSDQLTVKILDTTKPVTFNLGFDRG